MSDRLTTLGLALAAFVIVAFLFSGEGSEENKVSVPTTEDSGQHGLKGLFTWLQREKYPVQSYRKRFSDLFNDKSFAESGHVLIASMPTTIELRDSEWDDLADWLDQGNSLIILGAVYQHPNWAGSEDCFCDVKKFLARFKWRLSAKTEENEAMGKSSATKATPKPKPSPEEKSLRESVGNLQANIKGYIPQPEDLAVTPLSPLIQNVKSINVKITPNLREKHWKLDSDSPDNQAFRLLSLANTDQNVTWLMTAGSGRVVLSLSPDIFSNSMLGNADNAQFFNNVVNILRAPGGKLIFDDYHFGLSELYDPDRFFSDSRLHKTLGCLFLFWLCYVIGHTNRLAPVRLPAIKLSSVDFIEVMAGFFARRVEKTILAEAMVNQLLFDLTKKRRLPGETETWQWLEQHSKVQGSQLSLLKKAQARQKVSILDLTNTIAEIRLITL